ncbi:hypothetical protein AVEN_170778-1 [Araneus ventricosus]|uniref:Uncharacterized protein n=1 Tax=Araneus ventricosus TaxID=182803 RepID=A0A4Y2F4Y4_ARAVE|nr:hypothetical protein AVEN_170778-1 [Araneus ventricosus]
MCEKNRNTVSSPLLLLVGCTAISYLLTRASSHVRQDAKLPSSPVGSRLSGRSQAKRSPKDSAKSRAENRRDRSEPRAPPKIPSPKKHVTVTQDPRFPLVKSPNRTASPSA